MFSRGGLRSGLGAGPECLFELSRMTRGGGYDSKQFCTACNETFLIGLIINYCDGHANLIVGFTSGPLPERRWFIHAEMKNMEIKQVCLKRKTNPGPGQESVGSFTWK